VILQCAGMARAGVTGGLIRCEADATVGEHCYFHDKVNRGLITTIDGKPGGQQLSWRPTEAAKNPGGHALNAALAAHSERDQLLNEWDDATTATAISLLGAQKSGSRR
jgi:hypothetical protein